MLFDYSKICASLIKDLPLKQKEIIERRFGLKTGKRETLEAIGQSFDLTRERIRQIERVALLSLKEKLKAHSAILKYFFDQIKKFGGLKKEESLLSQLGEGKYKAEIFFLLTLGEPFKRFAENKEFYAFWAIDQNSVLNAKKFINSVCERLKELNQPKKPEEFQNILSQPIEVINSYLEISKIIQKNSEGFYGFKNWPEINPKGVKNKAYLVFKKEKKPLHFRDVAKLIGPQTLPQTVHNELIKDPRFVLVGRGIYALKEWGYEEGQVKDIILNILKRAGRAMTKEEILKEVLKQRIVKESTILLNLSNKNYFIKTAEGYLPNQKADISLKYSVEKT